MKIYFSPTSPFVRKCLVTAAELGLANELVLLPSNAHPVERDHALIALNPLGKVPTFLDGAGQVLYDSRVICEYLNDRAQGVLFPRAPCLRWAVLTRQSLGDGMMEAALLARYEDASRPEPLRWSAWRVAQLDKVATSLRALEDSGGIVPSGDIDIGMISIACALWYLDLRFPDLAWRNAHPTIASWYACFSLRASMTRDWTISV